MALLESGEMYLETILILSKEKPAVRSIDVAERMGFSKPSVSRAMGILRENGFITVGDDGHLILTDSGREVAERIYERHTLLTRVLVSLGVDEQTAVDDACRMEHYISDTSIQAIKDHVARYAPEK